jgi:hypothetical protein
MKEPEEMSGCARTIIVFLCMVIPIAVAAFVNYLNR